MASNQYHIPDSEHKSSYETSLHEALTIADSFQYTPETQPEAFQYIKDIESRIHSYREAAVAAEATKAPWPGILRPYMRAPKPLLEKLIEKEAAIGGSSFKKAPGIVSQRFWYHDEHKGKGEWFFESVNQYKQATVLQFQTTPKSIEKLMSGASLPFAPHEMEQIAVLPGIYEQKILDELYAVDSGLQDKTELPKAA